MNCCEIISNLVVRRYPLSFYILITMNSSTCFSTYFSTAWLLRAFLLSSCASCFFFTAPTKTFLAYLSRFFILRRAHSFLIQKNADFATFFTSLSVPFLCSCLWFLHFPLKPAKSISSCAQVFIFSSLIQRILVYSLWFNPLFNIYFFQRTGLQVIRKALDA